MIPGGLESSEAQSRSSWTRHHVALQANADAKASRQPKRSARYDTCWTKPSGADAVRLRLDTCYGRCYMADSSCHSGNMAIAPMCC